jgi:hypothetical protein
MDPQAVQAAADARRAATTTAKVDPRTRVHPLPQPLPKKTLAPPAGKGGPLWQHFYARAVEDKHPEPEKMADASLRLRESTLALEAKRHTTLKTTHRPKPSEVAAAAKPAKVARATHPSLLCKATCLNGNQCKHRSTRGDYCSKHAP